MLARNILLNHLEPFVNGNPNASISKSSISPMTSEEWQSIINFCKNGIKEGDKYLPAELQNRILTFHLTVVQLQVY